MTRPVVAVIDQGSTKTKAALVEIDGETLAQVERPVEKSLRGDRHEHDASRIAADIEELLVELFEAGAPDALGLTCQRSTCLLWERESGRPLTPALSWQDRSQSGRVEELATAAAEVERRTGLLLSPHYAAPKLAALLNELPEGRSRAENGEIVAGTLDAFLAHRLTGDATTEPGHAGRTLLYNLSRDAWDPELAEIFGIPMAALPTIRPSAAPRGEFRGVPLTALAGDQQAALLGHGGWSNGTSMAHFGTGAFVLTSTGSREIRADGLLSAVIASTTETRHFQLEGSVNSAGSAVDWACRLTGQRLEDWTERPLDVESLPWVLPSFSGAAAPWWRPRARATISGLSLDTGPEEILGGVLAGVAMRVVDCLEALTRAGVEPRGLRVSGKLTRLEGLVELIANAGRVPIEISSEEESGLLGIARLAAVGGGLEEALLDRAPPVSRRIEPDWPPPRTARLRQLWREFAGAALEL